MSTLRNSVLLGVVTCRVLSLGLALLVSTASICHGQVINEDLKLLAGDGAADDNFGMSIAIDNGVVAVGAHCDDDNGDNSGSAYLFNAPTLAQIAKPPPK